MLDEAGCVWPAAVCTGPVAGRGGSTADANTEGDPSRRDRKGAHGPARARAGQQRRREAGEEVLDGIRLQ